MTTRGALYIVWGSYADEALARSIESLKRVHPELPYEVKRLGDGDQFFSLREKARMMDLTPFDETVFLDADTVVVDRLDFGFTQAVRYGLACCICENPWARRYRGLPRDDAVEYNTGVLFFTGAARPVFDRWHALTGTIDSAIEFVLNGEKKIMPFNDQAAFAVAVQEWQQLPFVLPHNWNFRPPIHTSWFGPLKIWHSYSSPPEGLETLAKAYRDGAIIQQHSIG